MKKFVVNHVFVPYRGDLFLMPTRRLGMQPSTMTVFVPYRGDLFLIGVRRRGERIRRRRRFSSPIVGICF